MLLFTESSSILNLDYKVEASFPEEGQVSINIIEQPDPEDEEVSYLEITCKQEQSNESTASVVRGQLGLQWNIPIVDFHNFVTFPLSHEVTGILPAGLQIVRAGIAASIPYLLFCHRDGTNRISLGLLDQQTEVTIDVKQETQKGFYSISLTKPVVLKNGSHTEKLQVSIKKTPWQTALGQYKQWVNDQNPHQPLSIPETAYEPVFTTTYIPADDLSQDFVLENAYSAIKLGFKTWITAGGWFSDAVDDAEIKSQVGDWQPAPSKFSNLAENVELIQKMGMRYLLALAPAEVGKESQSFPLNKSNLQPEKAEQPRALSPWKKKSIKVILQTIERLLRDYKVDGFLVEGLDQIHTESTPANPDFDTAGEGIQTLLSQVNKALTKAQPAGLLGIPGASANLANQSNFNLYIVNEAPFNASLNRFQIAIQKILTPGRPVASAPLFWSPEDSLENIAVSFINALAGIPVLSLDLRSCELSHINLIKHWIKFYNDHRDTFIQGDYLPDFRGLSLPLIQFVGKKESIISLFDNVPVKFEVHKKDTVWILNASTHPYIEFLPVKKMTIPVTAHDKFGESVYTRFIHFPTDRVEVEVGGYLEIGEIWKYDDIDLHPKSKKKKKGNQKSAEHDTDANSEDLTQA